MILLFSIGIHGCGGGSSDDAVTGTAGETTNVESGGAVDQNDSQANPDTILADNGDPSGGGITGTGIISSGPIDQFGSVVVNGVTYNTDNATITVNGEQAQETDLELGMYVRVIGELDDGNSSTGVAASVEYESYLVGPISRVVTSQADTYKLVTILGISIIIEPDNTVFTGTTYESLETEQWIEVSGRLLDDEILLTTSVIQLNQSEIGGIRFNASIVEINGSQLTLSNGLIANSEQAVLLQFGTTPLTVGQRLEIVGTKTDDETMINADFITLRDDNSQFEQIESELEQRLTIIGEISDYQSLSDFDVAALSIDASLAVINPEFIELGDGIEVKVSGNYANDTLTSTNVVVQDIVEECAITDISLDQNLITVRLRNSGETALIYVNSDTLFINSNNNQMTTISFTDLNIDDRLEIAMHFDEDLNTLISDEIIRKTNFNGVSTGEPVGDIILEELTVDAEYSIDFVVYTEIYTQNENGILQLVIDSKEDGEYAQIASQSTVALAGTLEVINQEQSFESGDVFDLFDGTITGRFSRVILPPLNNNRLAWRTNQLYETGRIVVVDAESMKIDVDRSESGVVSLPFFGAVEGVEINWGDGTVTNTESAGVFTHVYGTESDRYQIEVWGLFEGFGWQDADPAPEEVAAITSISAWGTNYTLNSLHGAFKEHVNLTILPSVLPFSVVNLNSLLEGAESFNDARIGDWDVSNITDMGYLFSNANSFNQDIGGWNVSNVNQMEHMFKNTRDFNQDISTWNVSSVTSMLRMFQGASVFDQDISGWDVANVERFTAMFRNALVFNQDIGNWDVSSCSIFQSMFSGAAKFNQDISRWDMSNARRLELMFSDASDFDQDLGSWDVSGVESMEDTFANITLSVENYDSILNSWVLLDLTMSVDFNAGASRYTAGSAADTARTRLINEFGWNISPSCQDCCRILTTMIGDRNGEKILARV